MQQFESWIQPPTSTKWIAIDLSIFIKFEEATCKEGVPKWEGNSRKFMHNTLTKVTSLAKNNLGGANRAKSVGVSNCL